MKNLFLVVLLATATFSFAQKSIPTQVLEAFKKDHKNMDNVKWEKEKGNYEASFKIKQLKQIENAFKKFYFADGRMWFFGDNIRGIIMGTVN